MRQKQCYYECHITIEAPLEHRALCRNIVESIKWAYSEHDEDHEIGPGLRCYANRGFKASTPVNEIIDRTKAAQALLQLSMTTHGCGVVVRYKVEFVLFDVVTEALTTKGEHLKSRRDSK